MQRSLATEERQGSHQQQQGRPLERWEEDDEAEGGEGMLTSSVMKDWIRSLPDRNFDPDAVPDQAMANFLGGTVSIPANRPGQRLHCVTASAVSYLIAVSASQPSLCCRGVHGRGLSLSCFSGGFTNKRYVSMPAKFVL